MSNISDEASNAEGHVDAARKYHLLMELGRGGTAVVSAAIGRGMGGFTKLVVLKHIKEEFLADPDTVRMFVNEARLSARMNHPNVVQVYEVIREDRSPVIVMEYLEGQSLARIQTRAFHDPSYTLGLAIAILCRVLEGLHYAHSLADYDGTPLALVHRDVSPHNVMLTYDGQVKLVDFGIAKLGTTTHTTKTGVVKGKIAYMAPEQLEGTELDHRADLFAAGVMLWELVARRRMWGARSDAEIVRCLVLDDVPRIAEAVPNVDPELARICDKSLAVHPDARYASAAQLQAELEVYLDQRGLSVRQQDIAAVVTRICADLRDSTGERLKAELAKFTAAVPDWEESLQAFDTLRAPAPPSGARGRWLVLVLSTALAFGTAALVFSWIDQPVESVDSAESAEPAESARTSGSPGSAESSGPADPPPISGAHAPAAGQAPPEPPETAPTQVTLHVTATPHQALISLDGKRLAVSPLTLSLPRDALEHELRAEAEGFGVLTRKLRLDRDLELNLELQARAGQAPSPHRSHPSPHPALPARPAPAPARVRPPLVGAPAVDCDPPYYIGADGLKHYRRECL